MSKFKKFEPNTVNEINEQQAKEFIKKGEYSGSTQKEEKETAVFSLRMPKSLRAEIKKATKRDMGVSATVWILQAIQKRLENAEE